MWTETTRLEYLRKGLRHASYVTEAEWNLIEPQLPAPKLFARPRKTELTAVCHASSPDRQNRAPMADAAARISTYSTVERYSYAWRYDGISQRINSELFCERARWWAGRRARPPE